MHTERTQYFRRALPSFLVTEAAAKTYHNMDEEKAIGIRLH